MLLEDKSVKEIAKELNVSRNTVSKYKKEMPTSTTEKIDMGDNCIFDNITLLTKIEAEYTKMLKDSLYLYEDVEEGWIYHLNKNDYRIRQSGLWWMGIAYPDSVPEGWIEKLRNLGCEVAISPLHDKDWWDHDSPKTLNTDTGEIYKEGERYKAGGRKKAHWHFILKFDTRVGFKEVNEIVRKITNGPYLQKCRSLKNAYEYFIHKNHPKKYQGYDKEEIIRLNNFHIEPNKYEASIMYDEILRTIKENQWTEMHEVIEYYIGNPEVIMLMTNKPGLITSYIRSQWNRKNKVRVNLTHELTDEEYKQFKEMKGYE